MKTSIVSEKKGKPKRRSFRPITRPKNQEKKATAISAAASREEQAAAAPLPVASLPESEKHELLVEIPGLSTALVEHTASQEETTIESEKKQAASYMPLVMAPPVVPKDTSGKPTMKSFCEFPRRKRKKKSKNDATAQPSESVVAAQQEVDAAPEITAPAGPAVQIINGELVLQESSMICQNTTGNNTQNTALTVVEEEAEIAIVNATYTSFATGRRARAQTAQWNPEETQLFYEALRQVGLDFTSMESYFAASDNPNIKQRDRRQLKRKYQRESDTNPRLVEKALMPSKRVEINLSVFELSKQAVLDFKRSDDEQEEATAQPQNVAVETAAPLSTSGDPHQDEAREPEAEEPETEKDAEMQDPILLEDKEEPTGGETTLSLHGVSKKPAKSTRPKFRKPRKAKKY